MSLTAKATALDRGTAVRSSVLAQLLWIAAFAAATAIAARFEIPHQPVPFTLQTLVVLLAGAFLGGRNGAASQVLYLMAGVAGAPVFAGGAIGLGILLGPTGGYLLAFPVAAALIGFLLEEKRSLLRTLFAMAAGLFVIFAAGTLQLYATTLHNWGAAVSAGFLLFSWWDVLKLGAAATVYHEIAKRTPRLP